MLIPLAREGSLATGKSPATTGVFREGLASTPDPSLRGAHPHLKLLDLGQVVLAEAAACLALLQLHLGTGGTGIKSPAHPPPKTLGSRAGASCRVHGTIQARHIPGKAGGTERERRAAGPACLALRAPPLTQQIRPERGPRRDPPTHPPASLAHLVGLQPTALLGSSDRDRFPSGRPLPPPYLLRPVKRHLPASAETGVHSSAQAQKQRLRAP